MIRWFAAMLLAVMVAACSTAGYRPSPGDQSGPVHSDGGGGGGGSM